jgi:ATP-dependent exoDNAse (exonuclease V) beta subunit
MDEVTIAPDLNDAVSEAIAYITSTNCSLSDIPEKYRTELNLYYVACSRARKSLLNATFLGL